LEEFHNISNFEDYSLELFEFMEALNYLLSKEFLEKWKYKYSSEFILFFQSKVLESLKKQKPLKKETLKNLIKAKTKFADVLITEFYEDIDIRLYNPAIL